MPWERREGYLYYYLVYRDGGRRRRRYLGRGEQAEQEAARVLARQAERQRVREQAQGERRAWELAEAATAKLIKLGSLLITAMLFADGYRRSSGHWHPCERSRKNVERQQYGAG